MRRAPGRGAARRLAVGDFAGFIVNFPHKGKRARGTPRLYAIITYASVTGALSFSTPHRNDDDPLRQIFARNRGSTVRRGATKFRPRSTRTLLYVGDFFLRVTSATKRELAPRETPFAPDARSLYVASFNIFERKGGKIN